MECCRLRFGSPTSDDLIASYAGSASEPGPVIKGAFADRTMRGAGELRPLDGPFGSKAETAFSMEQPFQGSGTASGNLAPTGAGQSEPTLIHSKTDSNLSLNVAPEFTNPLGKFRGKVALSKPSWQFGVITVSEKGFQGGHSMMQKAKNFPAGNFKMPKRPGDLSRLTDHLVARLRDVQATLADHQPAREPEKQIGS